MSSDSCFGHGLLALVVIGGCVLEHAVQNFKQYWDTQSGQESNNFLLLLADLYSFGVISSGLIYDIIRMMIKSFKELDVELLLLLITSTAYLIRCDH